MGHAAGGSTRLSNRATPCTELKTRQDARGWTCECREKGRGWCAYWRHCPEPHSPLVSEEEEALCAFVDRALIMAVCFLLGATTIGLAAWWLS
jgi:hypothetical protein